MRKKFIKKKKRRKKEEKKEEKGKHWKEIRIMKYEIKTQKLKKQNW